MITKTSKSVHTPLPWRVGGINGGTQYDIQNDSTHIAHVSHRPQSDSQAEADAQFIIRAANNHESLLSACKFALESSGDSDAHRLPEAIERLQAAIQKAEGEL